MPALLMHRRATISRVVCCVLLQVLHSSSPLLVLRTAMVMEQVRQPRVYLLKAGFVRSHNIGNSRRAYPAQKELVQQEL